MASHTLSTGLAVLAGLVTVLSPCVLPILPILIGRSLQSHRYGPVAMVMGLVGGFAVAGSLVGFAALWITALANGLRYGAIALLIGVGILSLFPQWSDRVWHALPIFKLAKAPQRIGLMGEFWLGTQLGLLWTPCAGPILGSIVVLAAVQHQVTESFGLLVAYGLGAAIPLLMIAYGSRTVGRRLLQLRSLTQPMQRVGGGLIVGTAIAILMGWDIQIQRWLAPLFPPLPL